ncbi:tetratricopeptide repeat protein, partial [Luteimonas lutimaris]|uniref:tetratricopeptide repeat protein n=1 Tax=Luteimonas lutimaris TaxID=698645 RepID=UPI0031D81558
VSELAADLRAWRSGRPVAARRGGSGYRFRRLVMRHKLATGLVVALAASLAAGIVGFAWQAGHARQQAVRATQEAEHARLAADAANAQTEFLRELLRAFTPSNTELARLDRDTILKEAVKRAERRLEGYPDVLASVKLQVADTYMIMQKYEQAGVLLDQVAADLEGLEGDHHRISGRIHLARANGMSHSSSQPEAQKAALAHYRAALSLLDPVSDTDVWRMAKRHYSAFQLRQARPEEGLREAEEGAATCEPDSADFECIMLLRQRAAALQSLSRPAESLPLYEQVVDSLQAHFPENEYLLFRIGIELARVYTQSGRYDDAQRLYAQSLEVHGRLRDSPTTASIRALSGRAMALMRLGRFDEALASASEALAQAEATLGKDSTEVANRAEDLGQVYAAMGNLPKAIELNKLGLDTLRRVLGPGDHLNIAILLGRRATLLSNAGDPARALPLHRIANEGMARTLGTESRRYALRMSRTARTELALGMLGDARTHFDEAMRIYRKLAVDNDSAPSYILANRALVRLAQGEREQARADVMEGWHGVVAATMESDARAMRALLWALQMHCAAPASQDCGALEEAAGRLLASDATLPPVEKDKLETFMAGR